MENNKNFRIRWHFTHTLMLHATAVHFISCMPDGLCLGSWHYDESNQSGERSCGMKTNVLSSWETLTDVSHFMSFMCTGLEERLRRAVWVDPSKWTPQVRFCARPHTQKKLIFYVWKLRLTRSSASMTELMRRDKKNKTANPQKSNTLTSRAREETRKRTKVAWCLERAGKRSVFGQQAHDNIYNTRTITEEHPLGHETLYGAADKVAAEADGQRWRTYRRGMEDGKVSAPIWRGYITFQNTAELQ